MADVKISGLPSDSDLDNNHYIPVVDPTGPTTKRTLLSALATFLFNQANIPAGSGSPITRDDEISFDFVKTGLIWSGDSYGVNRNASMTAGTVYINGRRILISAVVSRTFTASKDTYVDILDNGDGTGTVVYTEVTNNAASPALAANSIRIGIVVTGASNIAAATSINQGQPTRTLPLISSVPLTWSDSLGNTIYPLNPNGGVFAGRFSIVTNVGVASPFTIPQMSLVIVSDGIRKIRLRAGTEIGQFGGSANGNSVTQIREGVSQISAGHGFLQGTAGTNTSFPIAEITFTPTAGTHTYFLVARTDNVGQLTQGSTATPTFIYAEYV